MFRTVMRAAMIATAATGFATFAPAAETEPLTGAALDRALQGPVSIVREKAEVRATLNSLAQTQRVACWLDRRVDPSRRIDLHVQRAPLQTVLADVAQQADAVCGRLGDTLLIGRAEELDPFLTQAEVLASELKVDRTIPPARRLELVRGRTITWADLDRPADVLELVARHWGLTITNPDAVPHDLWAAGTAAGVDAVQALSLVLGQFDLSFEWAAAGQSITIVPLLRGVTVERSHRPKKGMSLAEAVAAVQSQWPAAKVERRGTVLQIAATALQHEAIAQRLGEVEPIASAKPTQTPLSRRQFAQVKILRKPAGEVLKALVAQGLELDYDPAALAAAGVDLTKLITLEFETVAAEDLIAAVCEQAGLTYSIEGDKVVLEARSPR